MMLAVRNASRIALALGALGLAVADTPLVIAQDTAASDRAFFLEARLGTTEALGARSRYLVGPDAAIGVTFGFQLKGSSWGWVSGDYKPGNSSVLYPGPGMSPWVSLYSLTGGVSRTFGLPQILPRWRPFEIGVGVGATQVQAESRAQSDLTSIPPDAQFESLDDTELLSSSRWRPAVAARFRISVPLAPFMRLSATAGLVATHVGDVRLWNGKWESTGEPGRYRPSAATWPFGTLLSVPLTLGIGFKF
jgi:hypothetical protein